MSLRPLIARFLGLGAFAVATFFVGRWSASHSVSPSPPRGGASNSSVRAGAEGDPAGPVASGAAPSALTAASADDHASWDLARLVEAATRAPGSLAEEERRQKLLAAWAARDPRGALEFMRTRLVGDSQAQAIAAAISIWGGQDPAGAWSWVAAEMPGATHHFDNLLEVFGRSSTDLAATYAAQYASAHPQDALEVNLAALLGITHRGDFAGARALVDRNAAFDPVLRAHLNNFVAGQWARYAPAEAAAWVMSQPAGPEREQALVGLGESWAQLDPAAAASFAAGLPAGESRSLAMRQAVANWVQADPEAARKWVVQTDQYQDFDAALEAIATQNNFMNREPAHAITWATGIFDAGLRAKTMGTVLHHWYHVDREAATAYLNNSPEFTPEQRVELLKQLPPSG